LLVALAGLFLMTFCLSIWEQICCCVVTAAEFCDSLSSWDQTHHKVFEIVLFGGFLHIFVSLFVTLKLGSKAVGYYKLTNRTSFFEICTTRHHHSWFLIFHFMHFYFRKHMVMPTGS
jgi:hypothetical protein